MASGKSHTHGQLPGGNSLGIRAVEMTINLSECNVHHGGIALNDIHHELHPCIYLS